MPRRTHPVIPVVALLALLLIGLPLYHLFSGQQPRILELSGNCFQGEPGCLLRNGDMEARVIVRSNSLRLHTSLPLTAASLQLLREEGDPPTLNLYSVGHRREWAAASAEPLAEFPGEPVTLRLLLTTPDIFYTTVLTAEPNGN